jgi:tetratricopeptide (TPR) repeat protein
MNFDNNEFDYPIQRFEQMISSNEVVFFDSVEFENIITYYLDTGRVGLAKRALKYALDQHPDTSSLLVLQADVFIFEEKYKEAEQLLIEILEIDPRNEEVYILMANVLSKKNKNEEAINCLLEALELSSDTEDIHHLIGMEYIAIESYQQAIYHLVHSISDDFPEDATAIVNIVFCFEQCNMIDEAKAFLNDYINKKPYCEIAWHQLGMLYANEGSFKEAIKAFEYAIISDETFVGAIIEKAKIHEQLHQYDEAIVLYQKTLKLEDPTAFAYYKLGVCFIAKDNLGVALQHLHKCVLEDPQMVQAWILLMDIAVVWDELENSFRYATKAIQLEPNNHLIWNSLFVIIQLMDCNKEFYAIEDIIKNYNPFLNFHSKYLHSLQYFVYEFEPEFLVPLLKVVELSVASKPNYQAPVQLLIELLENPKKYTEGEFKREINRLKAFNYEYFDLFDPILWDFHNRSFEHNYEPLLKLRICVENYTSISAKHSDVMNSSSDVFGKEDESHL